MENKAECQNCGLIKSLSHFTVVAENEHNKQDKSLTEKFECPGCGSGNVVELVK